METVNVVVQIINTVGFPIACVVCLGWYAYSTTNKLIKLTENVTATLSVCNSTLDNVNSVLDKVMDKL